MNNIICFCLKHASIDLLLLTLYFTVFAATQESPEVQVLKEKVFKVTCNQMSKNMDEIYNTTPSMGNNRCFQGKENERPQRLINRSKFITSPYDAPHKVTVLPIHQKVWEAVTTLCDSPNLDM